ncbi:hypothetical protein BMETH_528_1 [methanotrophic bacterial endosymbiont of Bathymodiolus sp.]|nr:hypothetical protein BMETH_528_1 [methanotrophic bacterial endosymbiont of Bathymodiolus sp.]
MTIKFVPEITKRLIIFSVCSLVLNSVELILFNKKS